jgi:hypothetical protein
MFSHLAREAVAEHVSAGKLDFFDVLALVTFVASFDVLVVVANDWLVLAGIPVGEVSLPLPHEKYSLNQQRRISDHRGGSGTM